MGSNSYSTQVPSGDPSAGEIEASCRLPLFALLLGGALWLLFGSVLALIASIKFHSPNFLADAAWLTYGRVWPAFTNSLAYGFCVQAGMGVGLWLLARLGGVALATPVSVVAGALFWNLGMVLGVPGILCGQTTGFSFLEMPAFSAAPLFLGYLLIAVPGILTFRQRREQQTFVSQWFLLAALLWFPWIYSTAQLLLVFFPARGMVQAVVAWWYADNLLAVWVGLTGLAAGFYYVAKLAQRELHSHYLAIFAFWMLVLFGSWCGVPATAPVPAWLPAVSGAALVMNFVTALAVLLMILGTLKGRFGQFVSNQWPPFVGVGLAVYLMATLARSCGALSDSTHLIDFTWFVPATRQLYLFGFAGMVLIGSAYAILPQLAGKPFCSARMVRTHFWLALAGVVLIFVSQAVCGIKESVALRDPTISFNDISRGTLPFLRAGTVGYLFLALGSLAFLVNICGLVAGFYIPRAATVIATAKAPVTIEGAKA